MDNFRDSPQTIGELRATRTQDNSDWSPRDTIIYMLREIDSGRFKPSKVIAVWAEGGDLRIVQAGCSEIEAVGMLEMGKAMVIE
jgi:hypothetical protein